MENCTDYYLYDKANDSLVKFDNGDIVFYAVKSKAEEDCRGNEYIVQYNDLPKHKKLKVAEQVIQQLKYEIEKLNKYNTEGFSIWC
tara:strand:- start:1726 stop:1983 length:258 start_codon:yes stop_codon:yes gene_type:complete